MYTHCHNIYEQKAAGSTAKIGHTGLTNLGCTCFMNATLQALLNTFQLHEIFSVDEFNKHLGYGFIDEWPIRDLDSGLLEDLPKGRRMCMGRMVRKDPDRGIFD